MSDAPSAIVTGAGSGVGRSVALKLTKLGYRIVLVGRTASKLDATAQTLAASGGEAITVPVDLCDAPAPAAVVHAALNAFGRIDALVNVAGYASQTLIGQITPEAWRQTIDTNLTATVLLTAAAWPTFQTQRRGVVVNVSSMASVDPFEGFGMYAPAKAAVNMFTKCVAKEGADLGVRAVCVAPGAIETPMLRSLFDEQMLPPAQTLSPDQVAELICACLTGERAFGAGETILMPSP